MPNGINPPIPAIPLLILQVVTIIRAAVAPSPTALATCLFGADSAAVTSGEHSLQASLLGQTGGGKAQLVGLNYIFDEIGIGVQPDVYERGCRE